MGAAKQALSLFRKLGDKEGEKVSLQVLANFQDEPPKSSFREEALTVLREAGHALGNRDDKAFEDAMDRLQESYRGFYTQKDFNTAMEGAILKDKSGAVKFLAQHSQRD